jgi:hypothetical protein
MLRLESSSLMFVVVSFTFMLLKLCLACESAYFKNSAVAVVRCARLGGWVAGWLGAIRARVLSQLRLSSRPSSRWTVSFGRRARRQGRESEGERWAARSEAADHEDAAPDAAWTQEAERWEGRAGNLSGARAYG